MQLLVWRNGRRSRLKICRGQPCVGSSPTTSIKENFLKIADSPVKTEEIRYFLCVKYLSQKCHT